MNQFVHLFATLPTAALIAYAAFAPARPARGRSNSDQLPEFVDTTNVTMTTSLDNTYLCPDKKTIYLYVDLAAKNVSQHVPLNLTVVFDRSGSMAGDRIEEARYALEYVIDQMQSSDILSIVTYDHYAEVLHGATPVQNKQMLKRHVDRIFPRGGTNIGAGLDLGFDEVTQGYDANKINRMFLMTDGLVNEGITDEYILESMVKNYSQKHNVSVSTFGLGHEYNEHLLHNMADNGSGHFYHIDNANDAQVIFAQEMSKLANILGLNAKVSIQFPAQDVRVVRVFGQHSTVQNGFINIDLKEIHPNELTGILVQFEITHPISTPLDFISTCTYTDVTKNKQCAETQTQTVTPSASKTDCDQNSSDYVMDKVLFYSSNDLLDAAMKDAERNDVASAQNKVNQSKTMLQNAKNQDSTHIKDQLYTVNHYDSHLRHWHRKSHHDKNVLHKNMRHQNYKVRKLQNINRPN